MDPCGGGTIGIERLARENSLQHHLCAFWEDEVIKEASGTGCLIESEFLQNGEANPSTGRRRGWLRHVAEADLDELERRASFEEGCQILNGHVCPSIKNEPRKGREGKIAKVCADAVQGESRKFRHSSSKNLWEFNLHVGDIGIVSDLEVLQLWR